MRTWLVAIFLLGSVLGICLPASAHHGGAAMNDEVVQFKDVTVTKFSWQNPHCLVYFDAKDDKGNVVNWASETSAPQALRLTGWEKTILKPGDKITIFMRTAKSGAPAGRLTKIVLANGTELGGGA